MVLGYWLVFSLLGCLSHRFVRLQAGFRHLLHVLQSGAVQVGLVQSKHKVLRLERLLLPTILFENLVGSVSLHTSHRAPNPLHMRHLKVILSSKVFGQRGRVVGCNGSLQFWRLLQYGSRHCLQVGQFDAVQAGLVQSKQRVCRIVSHALCNMLVENFERLRSPQSPQENLHVRH